MESQRTSSADFAVGNGAARYCAAPVLGPGSYWLRSRDQDRVALDAAGSPAGGQQPPAKTEGPPYKPCTYWESPVLDAGSLCMRPRLDNAASRKFVLAPPTPARSLAAQDHYTIAPSASAARLHPVRRDLAAMLPGRAGATAVPIRSGAVRAPPLAFGGPEGAGEKRKETTWDRLTGPKLFKTVTDVKGIHAVPVVLMRIGAGLLMIHHGSEGGLLPANISSPEFQGFVDYIMKPYFGFLPGDVTVWAALHDYVEYIGGVLLVVGLLTRPAAAALFGTMCAAVYFHLSSTGLEGFPLGHVANYSYAFEEPLLYGLIFLLFFFNGAGPLSVDQIIYSRITSEDS